MRCLCPLAVDGILVWSDQLVLAIPNLIALVALSGIVVAETKKYFDERKMGKNSGDVEPVTA